MRNWDPDVDLDLRKVHSIVAGQFPQFSEKLPKLLGQGWDNICVLYSQETVFRLPTRALGGEIIRNEILSLPVLAGLLPLAVPKFKFIGHPTTEYPYEFVGYQFLEGQVSDSLDWSPQDRSTAAPVLGEFLRKLHSVELIAGLPFRPLGPKTIGSFAERFDLRLTQIADADPILVDWATELHMHGFELLKEVEPEEQVVVVHGDLYPRHILAKHNKQIVAVIDWGDVQIAHPGMDLSIAYSFFERGEREAFWQAYGRPVTKSGHAFARLRAVNYALALMAYAIDTKNKSFDRLARQIARQVLN